MDKIKEQYLLWLERANIDYEIIDELRQMEGDDAKIEDAFYRELEFGTGGLRGIIGAGTNRMNVHTVAKASQGLADYVKVHFKSEKKKIAISYDSRIKSKLFAQISAGVFAANEIEVFIYTELMPTPCLSYAVRKLDCAAGIMITASHNPSKYNGYKVYGADGCQITTEAASEITKKIGELNIFDEIQIMGYRAGVDMGRIQYIPETVYTGFVEAVKKQTMLDEDSIIDKSAAIVYSPLNGTGLKPVLRTLKESGYTNITVVPEQKEPNGEFPTCPYPNPEIRETMMQGIEYARKKGADLFLATDPDCDRVGVAIKNSEDEYVLLTGNETGILLLDYICSRREEMMKMPENSVLIKTIVTGDIAECIAANHNVRTINVLTGFKYIGEQIGRLEDAGKIDSFLFGFEESCGYLSGPYVRDKDAVGGVFLICEMFSYYRAQGISLLDKLDELYSNYGFCQNTLYTYEFTGSKGSRKMKRIMKNLRSDSLKFGTKKVLWYKDYANGIDGLPKSDVLKFFLEDNCSIVVRPSGTEPKLKVYVSVNVKNKEEAMVVEEMLMRNFSELME